MQDHEWPGLHDAILEALPSLDRVVFLFPKGFDAGSHSQGLADLVRTLEAKGVAIERRHPGDGPRPPQPCPGCGSTKVVLQGRLFDGEPIRELLCLSCERTQRIDTPERAPSSPPPCRRGRPRRCRCRRIP
jgi:hypothetical protein